MYDTAGQQDYEGLRVFTYAQSDVIVVCFSAADRDSFKNVSDFWVREIRSYVGKDRPIVLVATQTDLRTNDATCVSHQEGVNLANKIDAKVYVETAANDTASVEKLFQEVVLKSIRQKKSRSRFLIKLLKRWT